VSGSDCPGLRTRGRVCLPWPPIALGTSQSSESGPKEIALGRAGIRAIAVRRPAQSPFGVHTKALAKHGADRDKQDDAI
jgi:hypothetical protein